MNIVERKQTANFSLFSSLHINMYMRAHQQYDKAAWSGRALLALFYEYVVNLWALAFV